MSKNDFEIFLKTQSTVNPQEMVNFDRIKSEYIKSSKIFFSLIDSYLDKYVREGKIAIVPDEIELFEENLGTYKMEMRKLTIGSKSVQIFPVGALIFGSKGRIDMTHRAKRVRFVLVERSAIGKVHITITEKHNKPNLNIKQKSDDFIWKIATPPPHIKLIELNEDSFFTALMDVLNA